MAVGPELQPTLAVLQAAYPTGLPDRDYLPMLCVMEDDFCEEQLAAVLADFSGQHPIDVTRDAASLHGSLRPDVAEVERVRAVLLDAGYEALPD